jgi:hypothetical protein
MYSVVFLNLKLHNSLFIRKIALVIIIYSLENEIEIFMVFVGLETTRNLFYDEQISILSHGLRLFRLRNHMFRYTPQLFSLSADTMIGQQ